MKSKIFSIERIGIEASEVEGFPSTSGTFFMEVSNIEKAHIHKGPYWTTIAFSVTEPDSVKYAMARTGEIVPYRGEFLYHSFIVDTENYRPCLWLRADDDYPDCITSIPYGKIFGAEEEELPKIRVDYRKNGGVLRYVVLRGKTANTMRL